MSNTTQCFDVAICVARIIENGNESFALIKMCICVGGPTAPNNEWGLVYGDDDEPLVVIFDRKPDAEELETLGFPEDVGRFTAGGGDWTVRNTYLSYRNWKKFMAGKPPKRFAKRDAG